MSAPDAGPTLGRYLDALLADMDRWIRPALATERAEFLYAAARRVLVRLAFETGQLGAPDELGLTTPAAGTGDPVADVAREGGLLDGLLAGQDERVGHVDEPPPIRNIGTGAVEAVLRDAGHVGATVQDMRVVIGGRSKETILVRAAGTRGLPPDLVIRRDLQVGSLGTTVVDEHELLTTLLEEGVPVPRVFLVSRSGGQIGTPFLLLEALPGRTPGQITVAPDSEPQILAAARALAKVHTLPVSTAHEVLPDRPVLSRARLTGELEGFARAWAAGARVDSPAMAAAFDWLRRNVDTIGDDPCFVHGDYDFHNILFDGDHLTAVLDWELAHVGHAAEDLGYIKTGVQAVGHWEAFLAAYAGAGGRTVGERELHFFGLFGTVRLLTLMLKARDLYESGQTDDLLKADVTLYWFPRIVRKVSLEIREVMASGMW